MLPPSPESSVPPHGSRAAASDEFVRAFLDELAPSYDEWEGGLHRRLSQRLVALAHPRPGDTCLDMSAGTGLVAELLEAAVGGEGSVVSIDIAGRMLDVARARAGANTQVLVMPVDDVLFRDATFDVVTIGRSVGYLTVPADVVAEAARVVKPDGRVAVFCRRRSLSTPAERTFLTVLEKLVADQPLRMAGHAPELSRIDGPGSLRRLITRAGLQCTQVTDMVTGGVAADVKQWNDVMAQMWPAAKFIVGALRNDARERFDAELDSSMRRLGDDAYRYHHPYLFGVGRRRP